MLLAVLLFSGGSILVILYQYHISDKLDDDIASEYTLLRDSEENRPVDSAGGVPMSR